MCVLRHVWLFATPWSVACQVLLSMRLSRQEQWSGSPFPPPGNLPDPGIEPESLMSAVLAGRFFTTHATLEALVVWEEESNTTNPHNWGGWTGEEKHTSPTPFSKSLLSDAFSLTCFGSTSPMERQTSSSSSYRLFPQRLYSDTFPGLHSKSNLLFLHSSHSPPSSLGDPCMYFVIFFFLLCSCVRSGGVRKAIKLIVASFSVLPQVSTSQLTHFRVISIASLQIKKLLYMSKTGAQLSSRWNVFCLAL